MSFLVNNLSNGNATATRSRYALISAALPPQIDGIGDYTAYVAEELARTAEVRVLVPTGTNFLPIDGVTIVPTFAPGDPKSVSALLPALQSAPPDWVIVQFNPFSYGPRGWNPHLPAVLKQVRKALPQTRIAIMAHETAMVANSFKATILHHLHEWQFTQLVQSADVLFVSISHWADTFRQRFPRVVVRHLPVGANLPRITLSRDEARARLGIAPDRVVMGIFGQDHISRQFDWMAQAMQAAAKVEPKTQLLYIGPHYAPIEEKMRTALAPEEPTFPMEGDGPFPLDEVARRFCALDMTLCPYADGVSTRRGAFMASIQYGLATVGTDGEHTDAILQAEDGKAFFLPPVTSQAKFTEAVVRLAQDTDLRRTMGDAGRAFYDSHFDWPVVCREMVETLQQSTRRA